MLLSRAFEPLVELRVGIAWDFFLMSLLVVCFDAFRPLEIVQFKRLEGRCESIPFLCKKVKSFVHKAILVISFDARKDFRKPKHLLFSRGLI